MDEQQIRHLVRQAIAQHLGPAAPPRPATPAAAPRIAAGAAVAAPSGSGAAPRHLSVARFELARPDTDTHCLIEPAVTCNHCGHCQCYGH